MFKRLSKFIKYFLPLLFAVSCLTGCKEEGPAFSVVLLKQETNIVINTSEKLGFDFVPDIPDDFDLKWESSDPNIASVTSSGNVTGKNYGTATITVTLLSTGSTSSCNVTVSDPIDFVSNLKLDMNSSTKKAHVTLHSHIDGDTSHFNIDPSYGYAPNGVSTNILKARYLGIDTPESTGQIEEWGKAASNFTKERTTTATDIIIESDDANWNVDSTGSRALVWVWYKSSASADYRNLNLEIMQNGLSKLKSTANTRYGAECQSAFNQAKAMKKYIHSNDKDPDFYYGSYRGVTIKELRTHIDFYLNTKVSFECTVCRVMGPTIYVEDYDEVDNIPYGMQLYLGFGADPEVKGMVSTNNRIRVAGSFQYYEGGGTYQVTDPYFNMYAEPDSIDSYKLIKLADDNDKPSRYTVHTISEINSKVSFEIVEVIEEEEGEYHEETVTKEFTKGDLMISSSGKLENLSVSSVYTTTTGDSVGALSITCTDPQGKSIVVRTERLENPDKSVVVASQFYNKTINAKGIIDLYNGNYQLRVISFSDIEFVS